MTHPRPCVALFSTHFLPYSQTFVYDEIRAHERYDVEVFTCVRENAERFPYAPVHALRDATGEGARALLGRAEAALYQLSTLSPRFEARFRQRRFDLVHAHFGPGAIYALGFAERHRLPLCVTFHGYDVPALSHPDRRANILRYKLMAKHLFGRLTLGLCASNELRELLVEAGAPADRLVVYRLGIDLGRFSVAPRANAVPQVIMIGRMVAKKGHLYGLRAFAETLAHGHEAELTLVGEGPLEGELRQTVARLGIASSVHFAGVLPVAALAERLATCDVLLAPSITAVNGDRESGLLVVKEASACGVVPVGTVHGGIPEIIDDGVTGYLVPERNVEALAERLGRLLADPELRTRMAVAGRAKMEREYDLFARVRALETHYDRACHEFAAQDQHT